MERTLSLEDYVREPTGRWIAQPPFALFDQGQISGGMIWGWLTRPEFDRLLQAVETTMQPDHPPHDLLIDFRRVTGIDVHVIESFAAWMGARGATVGAEVRRQAIVRPHGLLGAVAAGFYALVPSPSPVGMYTSMEEALVWLEVPDVAALARELETIAAQAAEDPVLPTLRAYFAEAPGTASLALAAQRCAVTGRTLQRRLRDAGTSFQEEVDRARVALAQRLLLQTDAKLAAVALDAGFASGQHLSGVFNKLTGCTPAAWRKANG